MKKFDIEPKRAMSQNFLIDGNILKKMLSAAKVQKGDRILEIGAGQGVLTEALLEAGAEVVAIEKDDILSRELHRLQNGKLCVIHGDFKKINIENIFKGMRMKVVSNIPYHLTGFILQTLLNNHYKFETIHVMVQKDFAKRCIARVGDGDYSSFSIFVRYHSKPRIVCRVSSSCFFPKPKVDSVILEMDVIPPREYVNKESLFKVIKAAFKQRRKMLRSSLTELASPNEIEKILLKIGKKATERPQDLSLNDFLKFAQELVLADKI